MKLKEWYTKNKEKVNGLKYFYFNNTNIKRDSYDYSDNYILHSFKCSFEHINKFFDCELKYEPMIAYNSDGRIIRVIFTSLVINI